ncbi:hypothetical protein DCAR_0100213 [Daucus carota subsp. sativus]|uniref:Uncharacterized protein n=1 Tax=Daucus carota subsp. sativus TaxID=79200 RepID=A0AAF0W3T6_DAUCS|nr:hypothetical protein DCAR_0100213 [Daucus carota subsp. sativus]
MAREAHAKRARIKKVGGEAAELIPFASWAQSSAVFPGQIKDLGLLEKMGSFSSRISHRTNTGKESY